MRMITKLQQQVGYAAVMTYRALIGERDALRLSIDLPRLRDIEKCINSSRRRLLPFHANYVAHVSTPDMAASLELASFLDAFCELTKPARVADLGSGFSSFVFRQYAARAEQPVEVWSVDDDPAWLEKTRAYLGGHGLPTAHLEPWDQFLQARPPQFDLVLNDINTPPTREKMIAPALDQVRPGGVIVFDDIHKPHYRIAVRQAVYARGFRYYSLQRFTRDRFRRFSGLAIASPSAPAG
jgi:predicted O-methyltransferase YrrM